MDGTVPEDLDVQQSEAKRALDQSECICTQPTANGILPHHNTDQAPPPRSDRSKSCDISSGDSVTDSLFSSDDSRLLPETASSSEPRRTHSDCCVHCLLACLFCELPSLCSALGQCLFCGVGGACAEGGACCCCPDTLIGCCCLEAGCCEALMDCEIVEDCCGSLDCLEICLECCSICFPS